MAFMLQNHTVRPIAILGKKAKQLENFFPLKSLYFYFYLWWRVLTTHFVEGGSLLSFLGTEISYEAEILHTNSLHHERFGNYFVVTSSYENNVII